MSEFSKVYIIFSHFNFSRFTAGAVSHGTGADMFLTYHSVLMNKNNGHILCTFITVICITIAASS